MYFCCIIINTCGVLHAARYMFFFKAKVIVNRVLYLISSLQKSCEKREREREKERSERTRAREDNNKKEWLQRAFRRARPRVAMTDVVVSVGLRGLFGKS